MSFDNTITENDLDATTRQYVQNLGGDLPDGEPDLAVDGLSESILSRIFGLFGLDRRRR
ncbi:MAG: hypothetical protein GWN47_09455 [Woeseiaceae bacterium]|nr:hypothetical protein [Woeseiaceae bacterium]